MADSKGGTDYDGNGFAKGDDDTVFGDAGSPSGSVSDYDTWDWKQIKAAVTGMAAGADNAANDARASAVSDPNSLQNAANVFFQAQQVLTMISSSLVGQAKVLAGEHGPWKGDGADAFLDMISAFSKQVQANAEVLSGGSVNGHSIPQQLADNAASLAYAKAKLDEIDSFYADEAKRYGAPTTSTGLVAISQTPVYADQLVEMMTTDMRSVLKSLASDYQVTVDAVRPAEPINSPSGSASNGADSQASGDPVASGDVPAGDNAGPGASGLPDSVERTSVPSPGALPDGSQPGALPGARDAVPAAGDLPPGLAPDQLDAALNPTTAGPAATAPPIAFPDGTAVGDVPTPDGTGGASVSAPGGAGAADLGARTLTTSGPVAPDAVIPAPTSFPGATNLPATSGNEPSTATGDGLSEDPSAFSGTLPDESFAGGAGPATRVPDAFAGGGDGTGLPADVAGSVGAPSELSTAPASPGGVRTESGGVPGGMPFMPGMGAPGAGGAGSDAGAPSDASGLLEREPDGWSLPSDVGEPEFANAESAGSESLTWSSSASPDTSVHDPDLSAVSSEEPRSEPVASQSAPMAFAPATGIPAAADRSAQPDDVPAARSIPSDGAPGTPDEAAVAEAGVLGTEAGALATAFSATARSAPAPALRQETPASEQEQEQGALDTVGELRDVIGAGESATSGPDSAGSFGPAHITQQESAGWDVDEAASLVTLWNIPLENGDEAVDEPALGMRGAADEEGEQRLASWRPSRSPAPAAATLPGQGYAVRSALSTDEHVFEEPTPPTEGTAEDASNGSQTEERRDSASLLVQENSAWGSGGDELLNALS